MERAADDGRAPAAIVVDDLTYAYSDGEPVIEHISFTVARGETMALMGLSGCGKSTLCHCLAGLAPKALGGTLSGVVRLFGEDIALIPLARLSTTIGLVLQDPDNQIVTTTVEDELAFAPENLAMEPAEIRARVDRELELFGIGHLRLRSPTDLSGGEKRLVAIASVLTLDPAIVILDEPFSHLDERGRSMVLAAILRLQQDGRTLIVVEHDLSLLGFADRFLHLDEGRLASVGASPARELMEEWGEASPPPQSARP